MAQDTPIATERMLEAVSQLLDQYEGLQYCKELLERTSAAQVIAARQDQQLAESAAKLAVIDETLKEKERVFTARMDDKRAAQIAKLKEVQATLDRKQQDLAGWQEKAAQEVLTHDRLIAEMQERLAQVQNDYHATVDALDTARAQHANFVKSLAGAL